MIFPTFVYVLCFVTSTLCAALLVRAYRRTRTRLLLWSALSFVLLAVNNFFVAADMLFLPEAHLLAFRYAAALGAVAVLVYGFIWEAE
jgi:hypothetical protein